MTTPFEWIESPEDLRGAVEQMRKVDAVALDTEFVWEKTYYAQLGLVQAGLADGTCFLIDAVALGDLSPLGTILTATGIVKILHDAPQDLMILRRATGVLTRPPIVGGGLRLRCRRCALPAGGRRPTS